MNILDRLSEHARECTEQAKRKRPFESLQAEVLALPRGAFAFERALKKGLAVYADDRWQSVDELQRALTEEAPAAAPSGWKGK